MDPASFSFAVIAMFLTCCRGYSIFSDAYNAPSDAQDAARKVRIEGAHLANWGDHFEIRPNLQEEQSSGKLNVYLMRAPVRGGVFDVLCAISESFTDIKKLDRKYGIVFGYHQKGNRVGANVALQCSLNELLILCRVLVYLEMFKTSYMDKIRLEAQLPKKSRMKMRE